LVTEQKTQTDQEQAGAGPSLQTTPETTSAADQKPSLTQAQADELVTKAKSDALADSGRTEAIQSQRQKDLEARETEFEARQVSAQKATDDAAEQTARDAGDETEVKRLIRERTDKERAAKLEKKDLEQTAKDLALTEREANIAAVDHKSAVTKIADETGVPIEDLLKYGGTDIADVKALATKLKDALGAEGKPRTKPTSTAQVPGGGEVPASGRQLTKSGWDELHPND
jgi:hypothetical protein